MTHGYDGRPDATAEAWRNGRFHTGDMFVRDADGDWIFVNRLKDAIRRRGENLSPWEVEVEILVHPYVPGAAVAAVTRQHTEAEVLHVLAPGSGPRIAPARTRAWLALRRSRFGRPT